MFNPFFVLLLFVLMGFGGILACSDKEDTPEPPVLGKLTKLEFVEYGPILEFVYDGDRLDSVIYTDTYFKETQRMKFIYEQGVLSRVTELYGWDAVISHEPGKMHVEVENADPYDGPWTYDFTYNQQDMRSMIAKDPDFNMFEILTWKIDYVKNNPTEFFFEFYDDFPSDTFIFSPEYDQYTNPLFFDVQERMVMMVTEPYDFLMVPLLSSKANVTRLLNDQYDILLDYSYDSYGRPLKAVVYVNDTYAEMIRYTYKD